MHNIEKMVDKYSANIKNVFIIGDFDMEVRENNQGQLILDYNFDSLPKGPTCFKLANGRCMYLVLTNKKHSFFKASNLKQASVTTTI